MNSIASPRPPQVGAPAGDINDQRPLRPTTPDLVCRGEFVPYPRETNPVRGVVAPRSDSLGRDHAWIVYRATRRSRNALAMTETELTLIAALAHIGWSKIPNHG